jgi:Tfp pilus assembly protein PilF
VAQLRAIFLKAEEIRNQPDFSNLVIEDPKVMGSIMEIGAKIYMSERSWDLAEKVFQKAIKYFQVNDF